MRLFIALELPSAIRNELATVQTHMRSDKQPVRWVDPASMHLTLQFLGEAPVSMLAPLKAGLARLAAPEFQLQLAGLGAFPHVYRPEVIWVGLAGDTAALAALQATVLGVTAPLGFVANRQSFRPHLTLGRVHESANRLRREALGTRIDRTAPPAPLTWTSGRPILFESTLTAQGPLYTQP
jgi:RNA 2',3'-cyclic 3'-phosphodiesterase